MKKLLTLALGLALIQPLSALASPGFPNNGEIYQSFKADLNHDGKSERIELIAYNSNEELYWGQLIVRDNEGKTLWQGPKVRSLSGWELMPIFGGFPFGVSGIHLVGDIDGDGKAELVSNKPRSDVRPTDFRVFRWDGSAFVLVRTGELVQTAPSSGVYAWVQSNHPGVVGDQSRASWIDSLELSGKTLIGKIYLNDPYKGLMIGRASLIKDINGYKVESWIQAPKKAG